MATDPKEERLKKLSLFRGADEKAIDHLASAADEVTVGGDHVLIRQGHHHQEMFVLESGSAVVEIDGTHVADIPAGEFVGELGYFNQGPASATVKTAEESVVLVIPYNRFEQILDDNPRMVRAIAAELAERLEATDLRLKQLGG
ncbi:MAG: cyclic nucleotide-binding domain-containing protein [Actinomycetota bacterium]